MSLVPKSRSWEPAGRAASLRLAAGANSSPAPLGRLRVAHVSLDPGEARSPAGDADRRAELFTALYTQLHQIARSALRRSGPQLTVSPTTLLHEAYLKISNRDALEFPDRARFMAYASRAMRRLVIDFVRERHALKRGSAFEITSMPTEAPDSAIDEGELERISEALDRLVTVDTALAELVDLKFFCGFSFTEIAAMRGVSERTVQRDWNKARLYLHDVLREP
jgi:RNA polymerase sigma factor (TIGR02999 family)